MAISPCAQRVKQILQRYKELQDIIAILGMDELSDEDMIYGAARETARCRLELFILLMLRSGQLCWHEQWGSWFYQSPYEKEFIILRAWVEPKTRQTA